MPFLRKFHSWLAAGAIAALLAMPSAHAQEIRAEPKFQPAVEQSGPPKSRRASPAHRHEVGLPAPDAIERNALGRPSKAGVPMQIGFGRAVDPLAAETGQRSHLTWEKLSDGAQVASFAITSPGAAAVRAGLRVAQMPADAILRFYGDADEDIYAVTGAEVLETLERNRAAGETGPEAQTYWSPVIEGEKVVVEIELPEGVTTERVRVWTPSVSHLVTSARSDFAVEKTASACELDAMCYQSEWGSESNAVARIVFSSGGSSYLCTGTLLADRDTTTVAPYFLTANHCVSSQASASTLQAYWFYRSTACNSGVRGPYQTTTGGATLLYNTTATDTSFLQLVSPPPAGTMYAGWSVGSFVGTGSPVTGIHHPTGDLQKISFGGMAGYTNCSTATNGQFSCSGGSTSNAGYYGIAWSSGMTEPGSSGSGLFLDNGHYLIGQLYGGGSSCSGQGGYDFYGRFDVAYNAALYKWLGGAPSATPTPTPTPIPVVSAPTTNYSDLWWNPNESGWGLSITQHQDNAIFAAWYLYDDAGRPTWIVMPGGSWTSPTTFAGDLYVATGPDPTGSFNPSLVTRTRVGTGTLTFTDAQSGTLSYNVSGVSGTKPIQRQPFGVSGTNAQSYGDLWWNPNESGWGVSITQHYATLFAVWYSYDASGRATWYVMPGGTWNGITYTGPLYRTTYSGGSYFNSAFNPNAVGRTQVGTLSFYFLTTDYATLTYTINGVTGSKTIVRQTF